MNILKRINNFHLILGIIAILLISCSQKINKNISYNKNNSEYYSITTEWFRFQNPTEDVPYSLFVQYNFEKTELGKKFIISLKFEGYTFPRIKKVTIDLGNYKEGFDLTMKSTFKNEGVRGVSETIFFEVSEIFFEEMLMSDKVFFDVDGSVEYRFFFNKEALNIQDDFYNTILAQEKK